MSTKTEAIANADAHLNDAGLPTYTEVLALLAEADKLALNLFVGRAYISRSYIDKQTELVARIHAATGEAA